VNVRLERLALDGRFLGWTIAWSAVAFVGFGVVSAIIPNPVFGRQIPPEPFAIAVWVVSAPLMGIVAATYVVRPSSLVPATPLVVTPGPEAEDRGSILGVAGSFGAFLAIGCPVCNKIALVLLGTSGALTVYAPLQPVIGLASLGLLLGTVVWRLRQRANGGACPV
jgi:hypothetical protein